MAETAKEPEAVSHLVGQDNPPEEAKGKSAVRGILQAATGEMVHRSVQLLPTGSNVKMWAKYGEMAMKAELLHTQMISMIYWSSLGEIAISLGIGLLLITNPWVLWTSAIHLIHIVRGLTGIIVLNGMPTLQDIIETAPLEERVMRMSEITAIFTDHLKSKGLEFIEKNKSRLTFYGILTIICLLVDLCLLIYTGWNLAFTALGLFEFIRVLEAFGLLWIDAYYFLWAYTLRYTLPRATSEMLISTFRGNITLAKDFLLKELTKDIEELKKEANEPIAMVAQ